MIDEVLRYMSYVEKVEGGGRHKAERLQEPAGGVRLGSSDFPKKVIGTH